MLCTGTRGGTAICEECGTKDSTNHKIKDQDDNQACHKNAWPQGSLEHNVPPTDENILF